MGSVNARRHRGVHFGLRVLRLERLENRNLLSADFRTVDGSGNNLANPDWGAANTALIRLTTVEYGGDGSGAEMAPRLDSSGKTINPRTVSNRLFDQPSFDVLNDRGLTGFVMQWGQFLDHDMDLTEDTPPVGVANEQLGLLPEENISFMVPDDGSEHELPPGGMIPMLRSRFQVDANGVRQQINQITSFIDASNVYGSDGVKADGLRSHYGGFLITSDGTANVLDGTGAYLPFNTLGLENASPPTTGTKVPIDPEDFFVAGDVRSNEQPALTTLHTLFVREHNHQARLIADELGYDAEDLADPEVDEEIYQLARQLVGAEIQAITYNEFLPALFGPDQLASYRGYDVAVDPAIANIFAHAVYRVGHTMLPNELLLLTADGSPVPDDPDVLHASVIDGEVALGEAFFNPELLIRFGVEPYLKGLAEQQIQEIDNMIVDGARNLLFDPPAAMDLGATNLQRGRDHGLPDYNQARVDFGLPPVVHFGDISSDAAVAAALSAAYDGNVNNIDAWAAAISEDHIPGSSLGELIHTVLVDQFTRLRDGDRFYFENIFAGRELDRVRNTRLSDIIRRNTGLQNVQDEVFRSHAVFTYRGVEGGGGLDIALRVRDGELQVVKGDGNRVIASQALEHTSTVALFGTSKNDKIRIDASLAELFQGTVEAHGGAGKDTLILRNSGKIDDVLIEPTRISVSGLDVFCGNFEKLHVRSQSQSALATLGGDAMARLVHGRGLGSDILAVRGGSRVLSAIAATDQLPDEVPQDTHAEEQAATDHSPGSPTATMAASIAGQWSQDRRQSDLGDVTLDSISFDGRALDHLFGGLGQDDDLLAPHLNDSLD